MDLFVASAFGLLGILTAFFLFHSAGFAQMLGTEKSGDKYLAVSLSIGVGLTAVLTIARLWILARRVRKGEYVAYSPEPSAVDGCSSAARPKPRVGGGLGSGG